MADHLGEAGAEHSMNSSRSGMAASSIEIPSPALPAYDSSVMFVAAPTVAIRGYIARTCAPAMYTGIGTPGTLLAVKSLFCAAEVTTSEGMSR